MIVLTKVQGPDLGPASFPTSKVRSLRDVAEGTTVRYKRRKGNGWKGVGLADEQERSKGTNLFPWTIPILRVYRHYLWLVSAPSPVVGISWVGEVKPVYPDPVNFARVGSSI